jgi:hypothetical protein
MPEQLAGDREALRLAWDEAAKRDASALAQESRSVVEDGPRLRIRLMDRDCLVDLASRGMTYSDDGSDVKPHVQVLVLHYVLGAGRAEPTGEMVTFREFPGGALYFPAYKKRTLDMLVSRFGADVGALRRAGEQLGAAALDKAAVAFRTRFFPKLDVDVLMWAGDDEVPSSANILFDSCAGRMLSTEDVTVVAGVLCSRLAALGKA